MDLLEAGRIVKPHGLDGRMRVVSYLEEGRVLESLEEVFIKNGNRKAEPKNVKSIKLNKKGFLLELEGVEDIDTANVLAGCKVLIPSDKLEELPEGEYYWRDIVGLEVRTYDGEILGRIVRVFPTGGNDVYVCAGGEREILLPAVADIIRRVDIKNGIMVVRLPEGL
jgi:16S rRNA processing protein RimM